MSGTKPGRVRASSPRFRRTEEKPSVTLTEDDAAILRHVYRHRFVRADDLYRLFGGRSPDRLSRRLTLLYRSGFLDRPIAQIDRYHKGGSHAFVYGLDSAGARYLKEKAGVPIGASDWRSRNRSFKRENLDHTLAVSHFLIDVELACRARGSVKLIPFEDIVAHAPEETKRSANPSRWEVPVQFSSARSTVTLTPDGIFGLEVAPDSAKSMRSYFFLEVDRGTMTIVPAERVRDSDAFAYRATILRKVLSYAESWRQGFHKALFGIPSARVLMLTTSAARSEAMRQATHELVIRPLRVPAGLFLFGSQSNGANPFEMHFYDTTGNSTTLLPSR